MNLNKQLFTEVTAAGDSAVLIKGKDYDAGNVSFDICGLTTAGAGLLVAQVMAKNTAAATFKPIAYLQVPLTTAMDTDITQLDVSYNFLMLRIVSITGTGAKASGGVGA